jgi:hypothetical protein
VPLLELEEEEFPEEEAELARVKLLEAEEERLTEVEEPVERLPPDWRL